MENYLKYPLMRIPSEKILKTLLVRNGKFFNQIIVQEKDKSNQDRRQVKLRKLWFSLIVTTLSHHLNIALLASPKPLVGITSVKGNKLFMLSIHTLMRFF